MTASQTTLRKAKKQRKERKLFSAASKRTKTKRKLRMEINDAWHERPD